MKKLLALLTILIAGLGITSQVHANTDDDPHVFLNDIEDPATVEEIQSHLSVNDVLDGDLSDEIYVAHDSYTGNEDIIGDTVIVFGVEDSNGDVSTTSITVRTKDIRSPEITIEDESKLRIPLGSTFNLNNLTVVATDSYDGDLTDDLTVSGTVDTSTLGEYPLSYTVTDAAGNTADKEFIVKVVDVTKPIINGPTKIIKNSQYILSSTFYLDYFTASDDIDGNLTPNITVTSNEYLGNANKKGSYDIVLSVKDSSNNQKNYTLTIEVKDDMKPLLIIDKYYMVLSNQNLLSESEFIDILKEIDDIPNDTYIFNELENTYSSQGESPGLYTNDFELIGSTGQEFTRDLDIEVIDHEFDYIDASPGMIDNALGFIKSWWWLGAIIGLAAIGIKKDR